MKIKDWLEIATKQLSDSDVATARLDCLVLTEDVVAHDRTWLLAHQEEELTKAQLSKLQAMIDRRARHEPLAYIRRKAEFYGREFIVNPDTLQPRPETETMIDMIKPMLKKMSVHKPVIVLDVGTGSGCLAITAKLECPGARVMATELNGKALKIAKQNAQKLDANVTFYRGNLVAPMVNHAIKTPAILLCNLPYVPDSHTINRPAMQEPKSAIFGGSDGLDIYRQLFAQLKRQSWRPMLIATESLPPQHRSLLGIAKTYNYKLDQEDDFIQVFTPIE